jgi:eukaryotic-like serine/threonine-protein kinase
VNVDRWQLVEELYHAASRLPAPQRDRFLDDSCGGDGALRAEVESLLTYQTSADTFIETPALDVAARLIASGDAHIDESLSGRTIGDFLVLEKLGEGGMGVVYEAEDTRLGRKVALKFLPATVESDPEVLERFEREARAASALNHPNICTIYGVLNDRGRPVIEMERLEGRPLRARIADRPLDPDEVVSLALQIADGLDAAHAKGIVHRDLTPTNVFCTERGTAKILDFGVAKLESVPDAGTLVGTVGYMSPEQALGDVVDSRSDLFSLGAVVYEMATGRPAFPGDSARLIRDAIRTVEPIPPRRSNPAVPAALERIILKALRKDRDLRYQRASDLRSDLERLQRSAARRTQRILMTGTILVMMLAGGLAWYVARGRPDTLNASIQVRQITHNTSENRVTTGAISPDGRRVAYADLGGIHLRVIETGETRDIPESGTPPRGGTWDLAPGWFPDGTRFLVNSIAADNPDGSAVWMVGSSGGPQKIRDHSEALSVSPDGSSIAFGTDRIGRGYRRVWLLDAGRETARPLFDADAGSSIVGLSWSPDGRRVAYLRVAETDALDTIETRDLAGGAAVAIVRSAEHETLSSGVWLRDGRLLYSRMRSTFGLSPGTVPCSHWQLRVDASTGRPVGSPGPLAPWLPQCVDSFTATADGTRASYLLPVNQEGIYVVDLDPEGRRVTSSRRLSFTEGRNIPSGWTPDNASIVFVSDGSGRAAVVRQRIDGDTPQPIVVDPRIAGAARLTPDGASVLYRLAPATRDSTAPPRVMRVPIAGGASQEVVVGMLVDGGARCSVLPANLCAIAERSANGRQLVFTLIDPVKGRGRELSRVDIHAEGDYRWALSPDGTRVALLNARRNWIRILSFTGLSPDEFEVHGQDTLGYVSWMPDGTRLIVPRVDAREAALLAVDLQGNTSVLWQQHGAVDISGIPSPDGRRVAVWVRGRNANLWLAEYP